MNLKHWSGVFLHIVILILPGGLCADSWLGIANLSSDHLRFASISLIIGTDRRGLLLRSLPAASSRIWIRIPSNKPINIIGIAGLGSRGLRSSLAVKNGENPQESLPPGIYHLDINKKQDLIVSAGRFDADAVQVVPLWDIYIVALSDRLKLLDHPDIEAENRILDLLIGSYRPVTIPGKYASSPALMSLYSLGYQHGWYSPSIPELTFERVDYFQIEPHITWIANKDEILPVDDSDRREIFKEAFKTGWDLARDQVPGKKRDNP